MRNKFRARFLLLSIVLFSVPFSVSLLPAAEARDIYVRLADGVSSIKVTSDGSLKLTDAASKTLSPGKSAVLTRSGSSATVDKTKASLPIRISSSGLLGYNGRKYRGAFLITREFVLINVLDVEDYLRGVLPAEASSKWPAEYLKIQAIISRTYGVRQSLNRSARGYDVGDSTSDQVYRGAGVESAATDRAIRETEGEVVSYGNELAFTPFHSDSGGHTAANAHVWGKNLPYLTGVKEPVTYRSPNFEWTVKIPASQMQTALTKAGVSVGKLREVRVAEVDAGGRVVNFTFVGSSGSSSIKASQFRTAVGPNVLKSTMLTGEAPAVKGAAGEDDFDELWESPESSDKNAALPAAPVPTSSIPLTGGEEARLTRMTIDGIFSSAELMDMLANPEKRKGYLYLGIQRGSGAGKDAPRAETAKVPLPRSLPGASMPALRSGQVIREENGGFTFRGRGWGHGVGLSQWGAQALVGAGWTAERVLEYYYPGTVVRKFR
ncbi:MAG: SpoIID/LytB domain-containing protein [Synergistaceae bacterium]|nr:SpoIID/LytB domain-containing protein [Synergistaceae bacterium]